MVEYTLRESLSTGVSTQVLVESEALSNRQLTFECNAVVVFQGIENVSTALVEGSINSTHDISTTCNLD
jgi:hypothetical protein